MTSKIPYDPSAPMTQGELIGLIRLVQEQRTAIDCIIRWIESTHAVRLENRIELIRQMDRQKTAEAQASWDVHEAECKRLGIDPWSGEQQ